MSRQLNIVSLTAPAPVGPRASVGPKLLALVRRRARSWTHMPLPVDQLRGASPVALAATRRIRSEAHAIRDLYANADQAVRATEIACRLAAKICRGIGPGNVDPETAHPLVAEAMRIVRLLPLLQEDQRTDAEASLRAVSILLEATAEELMRALAFEATGAGSDFHKALGDKIHAALVLANGAARGRKAVAVERTLGAAAGGDTP